MSHFPEEDGNLQRQAFRRAVHRVWAMIQADLIDEMNDAEGRLARILLDHAEYEDVFEDEEVLDGHEFYTGPEGNPFLHVSFHKMVEDQLESGRIKELRLFFEAMAARGYDRHEVIHAVIEILLYLLYSSLSQDLPLDVKRYHLLLTRYSSLRLEDISEALKLEFGSH